MTILRSGSATDVGRVRNSNQDVALEDPDLFAVADGMGGHVGGEVAARVAVDTLRGAFQRQPTVEGLRRAVAEANRAVWRQGQTERGLRGMGTTLTATALVEEDDGRQVIALANVGDSRAYVYSKDQLIQVTADHSLAEEKKRQGQLTEAEAAVHPHRHILTRALGVASDVDVDLWELHLHPGDRILLCSDGLTNEIGDERIREMLAGVGDPRGAARALVKAAVEHGGSDNVTVVIVDVVTSEGAAPNVVAAAGSGPTDDGGSPESGTDDAVSATAAGTALGAGGGVVDDLTGVVPATRGRASATLAPEAPPKPGGNGATAQRTSGPAVAPGPRTPSGSARPLQAAELRRFQSRRERRRRAGIPRMITVRVVLFFILLLAVVAGAYALLRWYSMDDWYVTVHDNHLAIYRGHPGGFLWFKPKLDQVTSVTTTQIPAFMLTDVKKKKEEPTLAAARSYVRNLHQEYLSTHPSTRSKSQTGSSSTTTTTSAGGA